MRDIFYFYADQHHMFSKRRLILAFTVLAVFIMHCRGQNNAPISPDHPNVHKIIVKEVLQTTSYTYVHAEENGEMQWIAIPKMTANPGEIYYFHGGLEMGEFKSKELDRTFSSILFLNGLISPEVVEGGETPLKTSPQIGEPPDEEPEDAIDPAQGGITIAELYSNKLNYQGKILKIRGKVTKFNSRIMGRNWIHLQDGTASSGANDLTATSTEEVKVGDIIILEGEITLDKDFGAGYFYSIIMENSIIVEPGQ